MIFNKTRWFFVLCSLLFISQIQSQSKVNHFLKPSDSLNKSRRNAVVISESLFGVSALVGLNQLWYADYDQSNFHTVNDNGDWFQMDKLGHVYSAYQMGKIGADLLNWSGVGDKDQLLYGATLGLGFLTVVEVFDGYSEEWGFSWGDMAANALGTGLYVGQELLWQEQRLTLKYSFHQTYYAELRPERLGESLLEQTLKDYNGQTYWLSANINSFFKETKIPKWLNLAFGYGAEGLLSGDGNLIEPEQYHPTRVRQFYLSFDIDLNRINTNSHVLKTIFSVLNVIKIPAPTLEINSKGVIKLYPVYF